MLSRRSIFGAIGAPVVLANAPKAAVSAPAGADALAETAHRLMGEVMTTNVGPEVVPIARQAAEQALAIDPRAALAHVARAKALEVGGDLQGELDALNEALRLDPNLAAAHAHMANTLILLGRAEEAQKFLEKALSLSAPSEHGLISWFMGRAYFHMGNYAEAIDWLQRAVKVRDTWFVRAHLISAYALTDRLDKDEARTAVAIYHQKFAADWPLDPDIRNYHFQPKYRDPAPQLAAALQEYFRGLRLALPA